MPGPSALRRIALGSAAGAGVALLGFSFHGMAGIDGRLATIAQAREAARTQLVSEQRVAETTRDCPKQRSESTTAVDSRDY